MNIAEALKEYDQTIADYNAIDFDDKYGTAGLLKNLSIILSYITKERIEAQKRWNAHVYNFDGSNASGEKYANEQVPELYQLRKIYDVGKLVWETMRSHISLLKTEE